MRAAARPTLTRHLLGWVLGALLLVWGSFMVVGYRTGQHEADELTDGHLASVTALLLAFGSGGAAGPAPGRPPGAPANLRAHDYQQSMSVVVWDGSGRVLAQTGGAPPPGFDVPEGFATVALGHPPEPWRAFSRWDEARSRKVMVLLSQRERDELAQDIAEQVTEPGLWLLPVVALLLGLAIRRGLQPLYDLSRDVRAMDTRHAHPLASSARHEEFAAVVGAINTLVERHHAALARERDLAGEFAHELRTPLASLALQARALAHLPEGPQRQGSLAQLEHDALRAGEVLSHLLALARASRAELDDAARPVDLHALAQQVLAGFASAAHDSGHTLGLAGEGPFTVTGHALLLELALRNLVENALSHTAPGTLVEVQVDAAARFVQVCDAEPRTAGSPARPHEGRALGLGLGHRVVAKIAALHGATFESATPDVSGRNCYRIRFAEVASDP